MKQASSSEKLSENSQKVSLFGLFLFLITQLWLSKILVPMSIQEFSINTDINQGFGLIYYHTLAVSEREFQMDTSSSYLCFHALINKIQIGIGFQPQRHEVRPAESWVSTPLEPRNENHLF